jgi:Na+/H+ antiporter NhaA
VRLGRLPDSVSGWKLAGVAAAAGAPFTVSLFVAGTTFARGSPLLAAAQAGVLLAVVVCGLAGVGLLRVGRAPS